MSVIDLRLRNPQCRAMLTHDDILEEMRRWVVGGRLQQKEIASELGIAPARVNEMLKGGRRIQQAEMPILVKLFGMQEASNPTVRRIKRVGRVPAGGWREALAEATDTVDVPAGTPKGSVSIEVDGESMNKIAPLGCDVIVDLDDHSFYAGDLYVLLNNEGELTFKRYLENPARLVPLSNDPAHQDIQIGSEPLKLVGRVVSVVIDAQHLRKMGRD